MHGGSRVMRFTLRWSWPILAPSETEFYRSFYVPMMTRLLEGLPIGGGGRRGISRPGGSKETKE